MRLLIDLQSCQSGSRIGGIGRYSLDLAKAMVRQSPDIEHIILLNDQHPQAEADIRFEFRDILPPGAIKVFSIPRNCGWLNDAGKTAAAAEAIRDNFILDLKPDVIHVSSLLEGLQEDVVTSINPDLPAVKVVTLYDLIPFKQQDLYLKNLGARQHYLEKVDQFKFADIWLCISAFSAQEGQELLPEFSGKAVNIRGGIDSSFRPISNSEIFIAGLKSAKSIGEKFLLYTASFDQRKNQKGLIMAFSMLPRHIKESRQLVIVGNGWPGIYEELHTFAESLGLSRDRVIFTGRVNDEELLALYNSSELFVFPSFWEGLGMPVLEAMACGTPVIGSNTTSIPEVLGWEEASFDPFDVQSIARKIEEALTQPDFMAKLKSHALDHSAKFTWDESARAALNAIRDAHARRHLEEEIPTLSNIKILELATDEVKLLAASTCIARNEFATRVPTAEDVGCRIGWISSWGTRCGIAAHSANLLEFFASDVKIFASETSASLDETSVVRCWRQGKEGNLEGLVKHLLNEEITDVVVQFNFGFFNFEAFNWLVNTFVMHHKRVYVTLHSTSDPVQVYGHRLRDIRQALTQCTRIFVHSKKDIERLGDLGIAGNILPIPLGLKTLPGEPKPLNGEQRLIAAYGFFLPTKGLPELVEAVALMRSAGENVGLRLVNADYGDRDGDSRKLIEETKALVQSLGIAHVVEFKTDFLNDEDSVALLREADLIVYPYQKTGESASAAVRMGLASGVPFAVTPLSIFDDIKEAAYILPGITPRDLAEGIKSALKENSGSSPNYRRRSEAAATLRRVQSFPEISSFIEGVILKDAACEHWIQCFEANVSALPLVNAELRNDRLVAPAHQSGLVTYGPYISLEQGLYRLIATGVSIPSQADEVGLVEIRAMGGTKVIDSFNLEKSSSGVFLDRKFRLTDRCDDVEFIFHKAPGASIEFETYRLAKRHG